MAYGHVWIRDEDGYVEVYGDEHTGPMCALCYASGCEMCDPKFLTEECPKRVGQDTLPGLEYPEYNKEE